METLPEVGSAMLGQPRAVTSRTRQVTGGSSLRSWIYNTWRGIQTKKESGMFCRFFHPGKRHFSSPDPELI